MQPDRKYADEAALPLFGEESPKSRIVDLLFGVVTIITVLVTIILSFTRGSIETVHVFFGITILLIAAPQIVLIHWFRKGDLHPKFRYLIGYMMVSIVLLCVCAVIYFYKNSSSC